MRGVSTRGNSRRRRRGRMPQRVDLSYHNGEHSLSLDGEIGLNELQSEVINFVSKQNEATENLKRETLNTLDRHFESLTHNLTTHIEAVAARRLETWGCRPSTNLANSAATQQTMDTDSQQNLAVGVSHAPQPQGAASGQVRVKRRAVRRPLQEVILLFHLSNKNRQQRLC